MFCSKCGKKLEEGSLFCGFCGEKVSQNADPPQKHEAEGQAEAGFVSESKEASAGESKEFSAGASKQSFTGAEQIIGKNAYYYLEQFEKLKQGGKCKMNWAAFFLGLLHASYRNVWQQWLKAIWIPGVVALAASLVGSYFMLLNLTVALAAMAVAGIAGVVLLIAYIRYAKRFNWIYMQHVEKVLSEKERKPDLSVRRVAITCAAVAAVSAAMGILTVKAGEAGVQKAMSDWALDFGDEDWFSDPDGDEWTSGTEDGSGGTDPDDLLSAEAGTGEELQTGSEAASEQESISGSEENSPYGENDWPAEYDDYYVEGSSYLNVILEAGQSYGINCEYALYDLDRDGIEELIVGYGENNAEYSNAVWTYVRDGVMYLGDFGLPVDLYEAEDGDGIYAAYGYQGYQQINRITKEGYDIYIEEIMNGEIGEDAYYENDAPVPWYYTMDIPWNTVSGYAGRWSGGDTELSLSIFSSGDSYAFLEEIGVVEIEGDTGMVYYIGHGDEGVMVCCDMPQTLATLLLTEDGSIVALDSMAEYGIWMGQRYLCIERYEP